MSYATSLLVGGPVDGRVLPLPPSIYQWRVPVTEFDWDVWGYTVAVYYRTERIVTRGSTRIRIYRFEGLDFD